MGRDTELSLEERAIADAHERRKLMASARPRREIVMEQIRLGVSLPYLSLRYGIEIEKLEYAKAKIEAAEQRSAASKDSVPGVQDRGIRRSGHSPVSGGVQEPASVGTSKL